MRATLFRLYFQGPLKALPRAPTLMGHLLFWYRYTHGEEALEALLERFRKEPPFRLSSVYPEGWLPRPKLPPVQVEETVRRKAIKNLALVPLETFKALAERGEGALLEALEVLGKVSPPELRRLRRSRVGIDRATGAARRGILFTQELLFPDPKTPYALYVLGEAPFDLKEALAFVGEMGYGGGASVGLGRFRVEGPLEAELPEAEAPNAYATLAPGPLEGALYYELEPYWGRLGAGHGGKPFKAPYLRTREGSVYQEVRNALLDVSPEEGARACEVLAVFPLGVRV
ncbi:type III-A CRISPR-associated RAMP protein Csm4 [Thermus sp.]|uniref:type III-A CRISPR-associated RAMP protein Csm4 n=1 Tax=Thermus sp. TaxID=275 RepID=UPI003D0E687D